MPLKICAASLTALGAFGFALEEHRLEDRTPVYAIDREMDERLTAYVPVVRAGQMIDRRSPDHLLAVAQQWREGRLGGQLRDPMPARYGDADGGRTELVSEAVRISGLIASRARDEADPKLAHALFIAATEPLRTVQYSDVATLAKVETRRSWMRLVMVKKGFSRSQVAGVQNALRPEKEKLAVLLRHMSRMRNRFRVRFDDEDALASADPFFEALVHGGSGPKFLARR